MSDEETTELEDSLAKAMRRAENMSETPEEEKTGGGYEWPIPIFPLVAKFDVQSVELEDEQKAVVLAMYTGAGASFGLLTYEGARALSARLKDVADDTLT
jgi:hypothetical protein